MTTPSITEIMSAHPTTIERSEPISNAYNILKRAPFHHLTVVDHDEPVGMLASTDILKLVYDVEAADEHHLRTFIDHQFTIDDAMTAELRALPTSATVQDAAESLSDGNAHSVVVLDGNQLVGIVTTTDLVRYLRDLG